MVCAARLPAFAAVAQEAALDQDRRIDCIAQDAEIRRPHPAIARAGQGEQFSLDPLGQAGSVRRRVIGLKATHAAAARVVEVNADEDGIRLPVADRDPLVEWNEDIRIAVITVRNCDSRNLRLRRWATSRVTTFSGGP